MIKWVVGGRQTTNGTETGGMEGEGILPCDETALERAKSILLATMITGRERIKSASCNCMSSCSMRVYDALSTTE